MQIIDYASLQAAVLDWLNRSDPSVVNRAQDFIGLAESWMQRKLRARLLETETNLTGIVGSRLILLPSDYREPLNFWWNNGVDRLPLRFVPPELLDVWQVSASAWPQCWTVDGGNIGFERPCDQAYSFVFRYRQTLGLSTQAPTNSVLTQYPDLYLAAAMVEAAPYLKDSDALELWTAKRGSILDDIYEAEGRQKAPTTLSTEIGANLMRSRGRGGFNIYRGY